LEYLTNIPKNTSKKGSFLLVRFLWANKENEQAIIKQDYLGRYWYVSSKLDSLSDMICAIVELPDRLSGLHLPPFAALLRNEIAASTAE
jgi:hypothetical protein